ncbi:MAG: hypothetical protein RIC19_02420 [Phaeodactylibacter sp.]|uniref:hypothetical protein n=1 Tax=Phaeodactylibacter sp. TaxID=1940289 RepID=UPI0032ED12EF
MDKYINYLLADIAAATVNLPVHVLSFDDEEDIPFITAEEEAKTASRKALASVVGLKTEWFPPVERLSETQIQQVTEALTDCLDAHSFIVNFPAGLPAPIRYRVLLAELKKEVPVLQYNIWQLDFCDYKPKGCPFGEAFCQCQIYERWLDQLKSDEPDAESAASLPAFLFEPQEDDYSLERYRAEWEEMEEDTWEMEEDSESEDDLFRRLDDFDFFFDDDEDEVRWN